MLLPDLTGQQLGGYLLGQQIGAGGMGVVYEALQTTVKRLVAIKILPAHMASQPIYLQRFEREVELAARLEHPHILPIYDFGTDRGLSYIVMRLLNGGSLQNRINNFGRPPLRRGLRIISQIGSALIYAHEHNIIHRDLKASNVLFDGHENAYLADFGLARVLEGEESLTSSGQMIGTPSYMAPEQWTGDQVDIRADVYALGILSYYILTGRLPFEAPTPYVLMHKHMNETPPPPSLLQADLTSGVDRVIEKAIAKHPDERFAGVGHFIDALRKITTAKTGRLTSPTELDIITFPKRRLKLIPVVEYTSEQQYLIGKIDNPATKPAERAEAGRALNNPVDPRPGTGLRLDRLPDIEWIEISEGAFIYQENIKLDLPDFYIARCPVTNLQFQAFLEAEDGWKNEEWWYGAVDRQARPDEPKWNLPNHPRTHISWYEAVAFCRWLNSHPEVFPFEIDADRASEQEFIIRLPTEQEWEKAARGNEGHVYPWGNQYKSGFANVDEKSNRTGPYFLQRTTAVGIYPHGASPYGMMDMSGNVWEWCLTEYETGSNRIQAGNMLRVLRGGAWDDNPNNAKVTFRGYLEARRRSYGGFRVVCARPPRL